MHNYQVKLIDRKQTAENTYAFYLEKPKGFNFIPGQYVIVSLINPERTDARGNNRTFSIASAPFENHLMFSTRIIPNCSSFKQNILNFDIGTELDIQGPSGYFILDNNNKHVVFLAGGIGITPFLSIIKQADHDGFTNMIYLFYSNNRPEDAPFLNELTQIKNPKYKFIGTMTNMDKSNLKWDSETGFINQVLLKKYLQDLSEPIYYIAGPPAMVKAMNKMLSETDVQDNHIKIEEFIGY